MAINTATGITMAATSVMRQLFRNSSSTMIDSTRPIRMLSANAADRFLHQDRLVVEGLQLDVGRDRLLHLGQLAVDRVRDLYRVAAGLLIDIHEHRGPAIGRDDLVQRHLAGDYLGDVLYGHRRAV